jgi:hypothetical protein
LHRDILGVFEWQIHEIAFEAIEAEIETRIDDFDRGGERGTIAGKSARRAAVGVARDLIEQNDASERDLCFLARVVRRECLFVVQLPKIGVERAGERRVERPTEARTDRGVEGRILAKPFGRAA